MEIRQTLGWEENTDYREEPRDLGYGLGKNGQNLEIIGC